jgi:hypothetical protein
VGDEKLAAVGPRPGIGHGKFARRIVPAFGRAFIFKAVTRPTGAGPQWAAALDHEVRDDPVKLEPVVIATPGEICKTGNRNRSLLGEQAKIDGAFGSFDDRAGGSSVIHTVFLC